MSDTVISVENLGKSYLIQHQVGRPGYRRLSEDIADVIGRPFRGLRRRTAVADGACPKSPLPTKESFWALKDVSFEVKRGEVLGIIGRNGAGKSTLLKILSRITEPAEGRMRIRGRVASLLEVGTGFHPELTGRENIFLNGTILGMTRQEILRKFDDIVAFAEVEKFLDTPVKRYSSGMYVRLAFAVAAHLDPEILVVDEVLAVGDAEFQKKCLGKMQDVAEKHGRTVLFVSHNMSAVGALCSRALCLSGGRLIEDGMTQQVIDRYLGSCVSGRTHRPERMVLDDNVELMSFDATPNPVTSRSPLAIDFVMRARKETVRLELAVQLYGPSGNRIAQWDLRDERAPCAVSPGRELHGRVRVPILPLVEGSYSLQLWYRCARSVGHIPNLVELTVAPGEPLGRSVPVAPEFRGILEVPWEFDFS